MSVIGENARANRVGDGEIENRVAWPFQPIEIAKCFNDSAKRIDQIDENVLIEHVTRGKVRHASLSMGIGRTDPDGVHLADIGRQGEDPGAVGRHPMRGFLQPAIVIVGIHDHPQANLVEIGSALGLPRFRFGGCESWQEQARENRNDRDDDQKFDQGESSRTAKR